MCKKIRYLRASTVLPRTAKVLNKSALVPSKNGTGIFERLKRFPCLIFAKFVFETTKLWMKLRNNRANHGISKCIEIFLLSRKICIRPGVHWPNDLVGVSSASLHEQAHNDGNYAALSLYMLKRTDIVLAPSFYLD